MKRSMLALGVVLALLLGAGACGGPTKDERTAAAGLATSFAGKDPSPARKKVAACFGRKLVKEAGLDQLEKDKVLDKNLKAAKAVPQMLSTKTAEAYGDGLVTCFDFTKLKADIKKDSGAGTAQVDAYVTCLDKISDGDLKQAIVDQYTKKKTTATRKKVDAATTACGKKLGT
jgi:hypothetical protein